MMALPGVVVLLSHSTVLTLIYSVEQSEKVTALRTLVELTTHAGNPLEPYLPPSLETEKGNSVNRRTQW